MNASLLLADPHGARYRTTVEDSSLGPALVAAIERLDDSTARRRMVEAVELYGLPPLAAVVADIEELPEFVAAATGRDRADRGLWRLKQAVGVAVKLTLAEEGFVPALTLDGRQDQGRLQHLPRRPRWFSTARRYRRR